MLFFALTFVTTMSEAKQPITLFLVGDATMADRADLDATEQRGWGQLLPSFFSGEIVIQNHAKAGSSTKSVVTEGRWDKVLDRANRGDIVLIQLGSSDLRQTDYRHFSTIDVFEDNLMAMIKKAEKKHLKVILATPVATRTFHNGMHILRYGAYPEAIRRVAKRMQTPFIDIEQISADLISNFGGKEGSDVWFTDEVNLSEAGALMVGRIVAEQVSQQKIKPLKKFVHFPVEGEVKYTTPCEVE